RSDGDVWWCGGNECSGGEWDTDHGDDPGGHCGGGNGDSNQQQWAERKLDQWVYLHCSADSEQCVTEHWIDDGRDGGDDQGDELCGGGDGDVWRDSGDECGGGERDTDNGDDAGARGGVGREWRRGGEDR